MSNPFSTALKGSQQRQVRHEQSAEKRVVLNTHQPEDIIRRLKIAGIDKKLSLRDMVQQALEEWLEKNGGSA
ncbi:hypothetical protein H4S14_000827 [Agrobacterium vitis]|nr:hypothetical protein [Agrobacterium vitis]MBE1437100.1 hypothetical protein [Agrobacterium vitis]